MTDSTLKLQRSLSNKDAVKPTQRITDKEKIKEYGSIVDWAKKVIDSIDTANTFIPHFAQFSHDSSYGNKPRLKQNIDLIKFGKLDMENHIDTATHAYDGEFASRTKLEHYDIVSNKINLLLGEQSQRPFNFKVKDITPEAYNDRNSKRQQLISQLIENLFLKTYAEEKIKSGDTESLKELTYDAARKEYITQGRIKLKNIEEIDAYMAMSYTANSEKIANTVLNHLIEKQNIKMKFNENFMYLLCTDIEVYRHDIINGEPTVRVVNPLNFDFDLSTDSKFVEDANWTREVRYLSVGEIVDEFSNELSEEDIDYLNRLQSTPSFNTQTFITSRYNYDNNTLIPVKYFTWKSLRKIGKLTRSNEEGIETVEFVDESYKIDKTMGETIEWRWVSQLWEGVKIDDNLYLNCQPIPNQYSEVLNKGVPLGRYTGIRGFYSLLDMLVKYQVLTNIIWFKIRKTMANMKGTFVIFPVEALPQDKGWNYEKVMKIAEETGLMPIQLDKLNGFNQWTTINLMYSEQLQYYTQILDFIDKKASDITGITEARMGNVNSIETQGGIERSVNQSASITEKLFMYHNVACTKSLQQLLDNSRIAYMNPEKTDLIFSQVTQQHLQLNEAEFSYRDFNIYVTDSTKHLKTLDTIKQFSTMQHQAGNVEFSKLISILETESTEEARMLAEESERLKKESEQENMQFQSEMQKAQQEFQQSLEQFKMQLEEKKLEKDYYKIDKDFEAKMALALTQAENLKDDPDTNNNQVGDNIDLLKIQSEHKLRLQELELKAKEIEKKYKNNKNS